MVYSAHTFTERRNKMTELEMLQFYLIDIDIDFTVAYWSGSELQF